MRPMRVVHLCASKFVCVSDRKWLRRGSIYHIKFAYYTLTMHSVSHSLSIRYGARVHSDSAIEQPKLLGEIISYGKFTYD